MIEYDEETGVGLDRHMQGTARRISRRIRQFVGGITASVSVDDLQQAARFLPAAGLTRFRQMPVDAQRHSLNVLTTLQRAGWHDPDLAAAALLHDAGKLAAAAAGLTFNAWCAHGARAYGNACAHSSRPPDSRQCGRRLALSAACPSGASAHWRALGRCRWMQPAYLLADRPSSGQDEAVGRSIELTGRYKRGTDSRRKAGVVRKDDESQQITEDRMRLLTALQWADSQN